MKNVSLIIHYYQNHLLRHNIDYVHIFPIISLLLSLSTFIHTYNHSSYDWVLKVLFRFTKIHMMSFTIQISLILMAQNAIFSFFKALILVCLLSYRKNIFSLFYILEKNLAFVYWGEVFNE